MSDTRRHDVSRLQAVEKLTGHRFADRTLLVNALTHPSATTGDDQGADYERLEFLGDAVLGMIVVDELYQRFPELPEGVLTKLKIRLVSGPTLVAVAEQLGLAELIVVGESERGTGARGLRSALENTYEALVGAVYLDGGLKAARQYVLDTLGERLAVRSIDDLELEHPKSRLQEIIQADGRCVSYRITSAEGPAHARRFTAEALIEGAVVGSGTGPTKRDAEARAAQEALSRITPS